MDIRRITIYISARICSCPASFAGGGRKQAAAAGMSVSVSDTTTTYFIIKIKK